MKIILRKGFMTKKVNGLFSKKGLIIGAVSLLAIGAIFGESDPVEKTTKLQSEKTEVKQT